MGMRIGACIATGLLLVSSIVAAAELPKYEVVDLGTLGSQVLVFGMNSAGEVTGNSLNPDFRSRAFLARRGQPMINLGTVPGAPVASGFFINDAGQVAGQWLDNDSGFHAFLATPISLLFSRLLRDVTVKQAVAHACIWSKHSRTLLLSRAFVQGEIHV